METTAVATREPSLLEIIQQVVSMPDGGGLERVAILERLVALKQHDEERQCRRQFFEALARVQAKAPRITKNGLMDRGSGGKIAYALREDIDAVMRPIYQAEGFSVTWDYPIQDNRIQVTGRFTAFGHTEQREWSCLPDPSGGKAPPQASGSTCSYGQRYISIAFWDIITEGADTNGSTGPNVTPITQDQALDIQTRMNDLPQSKPGLLLDKLCRKYGVLKTSELRQSQLSAVLRDVEITEESKRGKL